MTDDFFVPLENTSPYLKMGLQGKAGGGKTFTAALVALGLHKRIGSTKPIVIFDTETSSKFLRPFFREHGIEGLVKPSRSLADLTETIKRCEQGVADILIIDSITHVWNGTVKAYQQRRKKDRLEIQDWGVLKPAWQMAFSEPFVTSRVHILMTGRAGDIYESEIDPETNKRRFFVTGEKMRVESETAYEPDLNVSMERYEELGKPVVRHCRVLKDRSTLIDGHVFANPTYDDFAPVVEFLLSEPVRREAPLQADTGELFDRGPEFDARERQRQRDIMLESIEAELVKRWPGHAAKEKAAKIKELEACFGTPSWTAVQNLRTDQLQTGLDRLRLRAAEASEKSVDPGDPLAFNEGAAQ